MGNPCLTHLPMCAHIAPPASGSQVRDKRVSAEDNEAFLATMEAYFASDAKVQDMRPELAYQVQGWCRCRGGAGAGAVGLRMVWHQISSQ